MVRSVSQSFLSSVRLVADSSCRSIGTEGGDRRHEKREQRRKKKRESIPALCCCCTKTRRTSAKYLDLAHPVALLLVCRHAAGDETVEQVLCCVKRLDGLERRLAIGHDYLHVLFPHQKKQKRRCARGEQRHHVGDGVPLCATRLAGLRALKCGKVLKILDLPIAFFVLFPSLSSLLAIGLLGIGLPAMDLAVVAACGVKKACLC